MSKMKTRNKAVNDLKILHIRKLEQENAEIIEENEFLKGLLKDLNKEIESLRFQNLTLNEELIKLKRFE
jgi:hypothetical protein